MCVSPLIILNVYVTFAHRKAISKSADTDRNRRAVCDMYKDLGFHGHIQWPHCDLPETCSWTHPTHLITTYRNTQ